MVVEELLLSFFPSQTISELCVQDETAMIIKARNLTF